VQQAGHLASHAAHLQPPQQQLLLQQLLALELELAEQLQPAR
jgi:hypothetical protein